VTALLICNNEKPISISGVAIGPIEHAIAGGEGDFVCISGGMGLGRLGNGG